ncbi:MAG: hypothetical protein JWO36_5 [Myxococcales bacterium]|nr:hypothetical protein [Myxococcales bacterium]
MTPMQVVFAREGYAPTDQIEPLPAPIPKASSPLIVAKPTYARGPRRQRESLKALPKPSRKTR